MTTSDRRATSRRFSLGFLAVAFLLLGIAGIRPTQAQDPYPVEAVYSGAGSVIASSLNIRTGPHVSYTSVAYLIEGQRVALVGRNAPSTWAQIELPNGFRGWVSARYLQANLPIAFLPIVSQPWAGGTALVTGEGLYLLMGPGWVYRTVELTQPGDVLRLLGRDVRAGWFFVALPDGRTGWAPSNGPLLPSVFINDLPITTPLIDYIPTGVADQYQIYTGPAYYYQFFDEVTIGQSVAIIGRNEDGTWLRVRLVDGREGWIDAAVLSLPVPPAVLPPLPETADTPTPSPVAPPATATELATAAATLTGIPTATLMPTATPLPTVVPTATAMPSTDTPAPPAEAGVADYFFIYPTPDINSIPLSPLTPGQQLGLLGRTADGVWVKVAIGPGETGWVLADVLQAGITIALLPIVQP